MLITLIFARNTILSASNYFQTFIIVQNDMHGVGKQRITNAFYQYNDYVV